MFPILDQRGRVIGFGGRVLGDEEPKYLNSPETPLFHKGRELYGLFQARKASRQLPRLFVVEGYMDVIALHQHGVTNAVATLGTATTPDHLERLFKTTPEVVFCFDGDEAGRKAAWRALEVSRPCCARGATSVSCSCPRARTRTASCARTARRCSTTRNASRRCRISCSTPCSRRSIPTPMKAGQDWSISPSRCWPACWSAPSRSSGCRHIRHPPGPRAARRRWCAPPSACCCTSRRWQSNWSRHPICAT